MNRASQIWRLREALLADPSLFAQKLDLFGQRVLFAHLTADEYRQASFLDDRIVTAATQPRWIDVADVSAALAGAAPARPLHFVFHAGHVGSTLVSRLLEGVGGVLALREPLPLRTIAEVHDTLHRNESLVSPEQFDLLLRELIVLWSRGYADTSAVILKATSTAARVAGTILAAAPGARALYLRLPLEPYLATLLAGENSPLDLRGHGAERMRRLERFGIEAPAPLHTMSLGELAALGWCAEQLTAATLERQIGERVLMIDFEDFLAAPELTLETICAHFRLDAPEGYFANMRSDPIWNQYAKAPEHAYSPQLRIEILALARIEKAEEIRKGLLWREAVAARSSAIGDLLV